MTEVVSIHSFRGGTGKSNCTANLAAQCALAGKRVAIIDTDIQSPGIHVLFGFDEDAVDRSLNDYLYGECSIIDAAYDVTPVLAADAEVPEGGALYLVPSDIKASQIARVLREGYDVGLLNDGFGILGEGLDLDLLFIDTHPGLNEETLLSITVSDALVLLLRPDKQDFQGTAVTVDVARRLQVPDLCLLVNKAPSTADRAALAVEVSEAYGADVAAVLPLSEDLVQSASGSLFTVLHPDHPWSEGVIQVSRRLLRDAGGS
jgi:septum site-determining protein MinD